MKKIFPLVLAAVVFVAALVLLQPPPSRAVVVAAYDLKAGHVLRDADLIVRSVPASNLPADVVSKKDALIGQPLRLDRGQGDVIRVSHTGNLVTLLPNERAISVRVNDASGVSGLLAPGQLVGVVITMPVSTPDNRSGAFSKATIENLRVLYIDPDFSAARDVNVVPQSTESKDVLAGGYNAQERKETGSVTLAVPVTQQSVMYDFSAFGVPSTSKTVHALELLAAASWLDAQVTLYLMPQEEAVPFTSPGLWLSDLAVPPYTPTPSPTPPFYKQP